MTFDRVEYMKDYGVKYREENKEEIKEKNKNYREDNKEDLPALKRKFWEANKKVSNKKIKKEFEYSYIFPTYFSGLKYTVMNS